MFRILIIILALAILCSCSDNSSKLREAQHDLRFTSEQLQTCQNQLAVYRDSGSSSSDSNNSYNSEPEKPAEPEYEDVDYYVVDGTKCYATEAAGEAPSCGRGFWKCNDGKIRECMTNVKYEIKTEKKLIEQE